jgi:hypothetical protein
MRVKLIHVAIAATFAMTVGAYAQTGSAPAMSKEAQSPAGAPPDRTERPPTDTPAGNNFTFRSLDANKDGAISRDEAKNSAELAKRFNELDKDGDGKLSPQEFGAWGGSAPTGAMGSSPSSSPMSGATRSSPSPSGSSGTGSEPKRGY